MTDNKRKMHVHRVYQTDDDGNIEDDSVWIDLARIDKLTVSFGGDRNGSTGQIVHYVMDLRATRFRPPKGEPTTRSRSNSREAEAVETAAASPSPFSAC